MYKKVDNPKDFKKKNIYEKSLSFRFYFFFTAVIIAFIISLIKDFIKLQN